MAAILIFALCIYLRLAWHVSIYFYQDPREICVKMSWLIFNLAAHCHDHVPVWHDESSLETVQHFWLLHPIILAYAETGETYHLRLWSWHDLISIGLLQNPDWNLIFSIFKSRKNHLKVSLQIAKYWWSKIEVNY